MKTAVLTSPEQWFVPYAKQLAERISAELHHSHADMTDGYDVVFILGYHRIIPAQYLSNNRHNIVIHESDLPHGKGWAPLFWQVIEGKRKIVFTMFEASSGVDNGDVYMKRTLELTGYELNAELRRKQAELTMQMCEEFIANYEEFKTPVGQSGEETFYKKRTAVHSELDVDKTIREQFNLLRTVDNESYPAFFSVDGKKYIIKIYGSEE